MTPILENCILNSDFDAASFNLLNIGLVDPAPTNLVVTSDPRLTDNRIPLPSSVVDASVNDFAGIQQSKLSLNGVIPVAWLGTTSTTAAQGDLAEYVANKGQPGGYAALDGGGKVPSMQLPTGIGTGTVTSVGLTMPAEFSVANAPVTGADTIAVTWVNVADGSWFGNKSGGSAAPQFYSTALPVSLIPNLPASQITTGTLAAALLPVAVGVGGGHAIGAVPDPGASGDATDYLARDMTYRTIPTLGATYQPVVPDPVFKASANLVGARTVIIEDSLSDATIFFSIDDSSGGYAELPDVGYVSVPALSTVYSYAAAQGYTNSNIVSYTNPDYYS